MKYLSLSLVALVAVAMACSPAMAAHLANPNRLVDPGFEGAITTDGAPFIGSWEGFNAQDATADFTTTMPRTDLQALELNITGANTFAGAFQDVAVNPIHAGNRFWYSGWHKALGDLGGTELRVEWRDSGSNTEVTRTVSPNTGPAGAAYEEFILSDLIPAGADIARIVYNIQSFGAGPNQQTFADDLNFNFVPEPASLALVSLAGLAIASMRRRK